MRKTVLIVSALLLLLSAGRSVALEAHQKDAIERLAAAAASAKVSAASMARHYALLLWVEDFCNGRSSETVRARLLEKGSLDKDAFEAGWMDTFEMLGKTDPKAMCVLALDLYGPEGSQIRGAWMPKPAEGR